jgi:hypothetical protein
MITGDESSFEYKYVRPRIWTAGDDNTLEMAYGNMSPEKVYRPWLIGQNSVPLADKFFASGWNREKRKLVVHIHNAPSHNPKMTHIFIENKSLKSLLHLSDSQVISPQDFYLFKKVKLTLIRSEIPDESEVFEIATQILNGISNEGSSRSFGVRLTTSKT